jgi:hypothetical protein
MCRLCHENKIPTLVDGAHVPGSLPSELINIPDTHATFYVVTFHKWCHTPRGASGGLWVNQSQIEEQLYTKEIDVSKLVVEGGWQQQGSKAYDDYSSYLDASKPGYLTDSLTQGIYDESTREYENMLVLPHCLFLVRKHQETFQRHCKQLRTKSVEIVQTKWEATNEEVHTWMGDRKDDDDNSFQLSNMLSIPLPTGKLLAAARFSNNNPLALPQKLRLLKTYLVPKLWMEYAIEVPIFVFREEQLGVRVSFGRHVVEQDIERLADAICRIIDEGFLVVA